MIEPPTWTVGPSRPVEAPHSRPAVITTILPSATRSDTSGARAAWSGSRSAAITCGMPLPCELGNTLMASNTARPNPSGRDHKRQVGRDVEQTAKGSLGVIREPGHQDRRETYRDTPRAGTEAAAASA